MPYLHHQENEMAEGYSTIVSSEKMFESDVKNVSKNSKTNSHYYGLFTLLWIIMDCVILIMVQQTQELYYINGQLMCLTPFLLLTPAPPKSAQCIS